MLYLFLAALPVFAQFDPQNARVLVYVPQIVDGGDAVQKWQTTLQLLNASAFDATCTFDFLTSSGRPWIVNFGVGQQSTITARIPAQGRTTLRSLGVGTQVQSGWMSGFCTYPISVNALFRVADRGRETAEIAAAAVMPSPRYVAAANRDLGVAIANIYLSGINVKVLAVDAQGRNVAARTVPICSQCQAVGNLNTWMPELPSNFEGTMVILSQDPQMVFVAWALHSERGLLAPLPDGSLSWPVSHYDRIQEIWYKLLNNAVRLFPQYSLETARLHVSHEPVINAFATSSGDVTIHIALAQLISDSPSELASVIAHEIAHVLQFRKRGAILNPQNIELDADAVGTMLLLASGFDPYASAGAFGKLMMASRRTSLVAQAFDNLTDPHTSLANRIGEQMNLLDSVCGLPDFKSFCADYKNLIHPNFPSTLPLHKPGLGSLYERQAPVH